jgi:peptidoglycan/LPS O-acetylase OafA/YrhL
MSESYKAPPPRRTIAVTIAGFLLLLPAAVCALGAILFATGDFLRNAYASVVFLVATAILGYAGFTTIRRWRGWRIWAGTTAWGLIALVVFNLFARPQPPGTDRSIGRVMFSLIVAVAVFVLVAKRRERKSDLAAVFDD